MWSFLYNRKKSVKRDSKKFSEFCCRTGDHLYDGMGVNGRISLDICAIFNVAFDDPIINCCQVTLFEIDIYGCCQVTLFEIDIYGLYLIKFEKAGKV